MEDIIDLIATDSPAAEITDSIKQSLFAKSAEKIESIKPLISDSLLGDEEI
jgi:hypothetical protein